MNKDTPEFNYTMWWVDLEDIYWALHPNSVEYIFFSTAHGTFSKTDHILGYKGKS
jgi:hypothetical protein